ncbi:MAG: RHS repeat-associated core domain-containing protein, partial [Cytophagia bacterium]|nr:RHS repeat-associated core domain-containing protein [Cytophagia bacterium]
AITEFENSPLNRVMKQGAPGAQWQPTNKPIQFAYLINKHGTSAQGEESLPIFSIQEISTPPTTEFVITTTANYASGSLFINATTDENGRQVREYVDKQGKTLIKKVQYTDATPNTFNDTHWAITYYIYDDFDRLRFVLQPEFWTNLSTYNGYGNADKRILLGKLAFEYRYDERGRMVYKKVPGADPVEMVYDQWDRLVMTRDGKQKEESKWSFIKYDALNRPIMTGEISNGNDASYHQSALNTFSIRYEEPESNNVGYNFDETYPTSATINDIYTITYYDNYAFKTNLGLGNAYDYASTYFNSVKGLVTATKERVLNTSPIQWLISVNYYDDRYRLIHNVSDDHLLNKNRVTNTYYGITSWITSSTLVHGTNKLVSTTNTAYDHRGRVLSVTQSLDQGNAVMLVANQYNELGQLIEKNQHSTDGGKNFLQSVDHRYNIRGWLTHINNRQLSNDGTVNNDGNDLFGMELNYNSGVTVGSDNIDAQFNGKRNGGSWNADMGMFNEHNITYDRNGNITALQRTAKLNGATAIMDNLNYAYAGLGNQLSKVDDVSAYDNPSATNGDFGFTEITQQTTEYGYDKNGNMKYDLNKGIVNISYNHLNLPSQVQLETQNGKVRTIDYTYTASGAKLKKIAKVGTETVGETDYIGGIHYEKGQLAFVQTGEGRAIKNNSNWEYEYHLKDHLGNARVVYGLLQDVAEYKATMETEFAGDEAAKFGNMQNQIRVTVIPISPPQTYISANHTRPSTQLSSPNEGIELNGHASLNRPIGPTKMLQVKSGERVTAEVFARCPDNVLVNSNSVITTLAGAIATGFGIVSTGETSYTAISNYTPISAAAGIRNSGLPKAYLCYMLFDNNYTPVQHGYYEVHDESRLRFEKLSFDEVMPIDGYIYIFVANESNVSNTASAYFDDLSVVHYKNTSSLKVTQVQDYYPFGLTFNTYQKESSTDNKHLYNGKELQNDLNLGWLDYGARMYMSDIGRWGVVDPFADKYFTLTPYSYVANSPVLLTDPDGRQISFSLQYDNNGNVSGVTLTVTGKVINNSSRDFSDKKMERIRNRIVGGLAGIKIDNSSSISFNVVAKIEVANSESDISYSDHVFRLVDKVEKVSGVDQPAEGSEAQGWAPLGEKVIYLQNGFAADLAGHEFGHSAGLKHIDETSQADLDPGKADFLKYNASNNSNFPGCECALQDFIRMKTTFYTSQHFRGNLMHRGVMKDGTGEYVNNPNRGNKVTQEQVESIIYKIRNNNIGINGNRQK